MRRMSKVGLILAAMAALALVGAGGAMAHGGPGGGKGGPGMTASGMKMEAARLAEKATFQAAVAKSLGTTTAKLSAAIKASSLAAVDAALAAKEITADEAKALKDAINDGTLPPGRFATAAGVAKELGTTEAKVNAAYGDAAKAQAKAKVDQAVKDGKITQAYADELKKKIDAATFPGFGAGKMMGKGPRGFGFGMGLGMGKAGGAKTTAFGR